MDGTRPSALLLLLLLLLVSVSVSVSVSVLLVCGESEKVHRMVHDMLEEGGDWEDQEWEAREDRREARLARSLDLDNHVEELDMGDSLEDAMGDPLDDDFADDGGVGAHHLHGGW